LLPSKQLRGEEMFNKRNEGTYRERESMREREHKKNDWKDLT